MARIPDDPCSLARALGVLGERWTFLILREANAGETRFAGFRERLGIAPDILSDRLGTLVFYRVMEKVPYQESGARSRAAYVLTPAGQELTVVLAALRQWGDKHLPRPEGPSMLCRVAGTKRAAHVGFVDNQGRELPISSVALIPSSV